MNSFYKFIPLLGVATLLGCDEKNTVFDNPSITLKDGAPIKIEKPAEEAIKTFTEAGNPSAARLSERTDRKVSQSPAITIAGTGLSLTQKVYAASTPSGANYMRSIYTITNTSEKPVEIDRFTLLDGTTTLKTTPQIIGNTDGAVLYAQLEPNLFMWCAIEHPMTRYEITPSTPAVSRDVPVKSSYSIADLTNLSADRGSFYVPVEVTQAPVSITMTYQGGNLRAALYGVEAIEATTGVILDADIHEGTTGNVSTQNTYTLKQVKPGQQLVLRVIAGTDGKGSSNGAISLVGATAKPLALTTPATPAKVMGYIPVVDTLLPGKSLTYSMSMGIFEEKSQFRRLFNEYLNAERAHPHRMLPHYNSWYDLCINRNDLPVEKRFTREEALASMSAFRKELWEKRGVFINSYLWDDGWDNFDSLWGFNENFPNGFKELADEAHKVPGASISCWMSPFGGYGGSYARRVQYAKKNGIIDQNASGMQLSKQKYYEAFRDRVLQMIRDYDMNLFKFDRMGSGSDANGAAPRYAADLRAVGNLCAEMRAAKQDVFINCTVGTWASPFWLMWCDSVWKGDGDCDWLGSVGTARQKWVTYRDNIIYDRFVSKSPLFPLNSMMMHGIIVCKSSPWNTMTDYKGTGNYEYAGEKYATPTACADFAAEVWMGVALGTGLQEYYITPSLMSETWWDILANGVKWIKKNEAVLTDVHWIGGDPGAGQDLQKRGNEPKDIYGYASLGTEKGIVMLRNPSDKPQTITASIDTWLEMPNARKGTSFKPVVIFNSTTAYENAGKPGAFTPTWPKTTAETVTWTLPPFTTFLFETEF